MKRDPIGYADGPSLYEYVGSSALIAVDPFGLMSIQSIPVFLPGNDPATNPPGNPGSSWLPEWMDSGFDIGFIDGLRVWLSLTDKAKQMNEDFWKGWYLDGKPLAPNADATPQNAVKHCILACFLAQSIGQEDALQTLENHGASDIDWAQDKYSNQPRKLNNELKKSAMDQYNNSIGLQVAAAIGGNGSCSSACGDALTLGLLQLFP